MNAFHLEILKAIHIINGNRSKPRHQKPRSPNSIPENRNLHEHAVEVSALTKIYTAKIWNTKSRMIS